MLHRSIVNTKVDSSNNLRHSCVDVDVNEEVLNEDDETDEGCEVEGEISPYIFSTCLFSTKSKLQLIVRS